MLRRKVFCLSHYGESFDATRGLRQTRQPNDPSWGWEVSWFHWWSSCWWLWLDHCLVVSWRRHVKSDSSSCAETWKVIRDQLRATVSENFVGKTVQHIMFFQAKFCTYLSVTLTNASSSTHLVKWSIMTRTNRLCLQLGRGPTISISQHMNGYGTVMVLNS